MAWKLEYFELLECDPDSDTKTIKDSFKRAALKYHPDKQPVGASTEAIEIAKKKFIKVKEAHDVLTKQDRCLFNDSLSDLFSNWERATQMQSESISKLCEIMHTIRHGIDEMNKKVDEMNKKVDEMIKKVDEMNKKVDEMNKEVDEMKKDVIHCQRRYLRVINVQCNLEN